MLSPQAQVPVALTIAGSDSSGGAGIQADLKTLAAFGVYGASAVTAITAQDTQGVRSVYPLPTDLVAMQIDAVVPDLAIAVTKTGMLASAEIASAVAHCVRRWNLRLVLDPIIASTNGTPLLASEAFNILRENLLPLAEIITPNLSEAALLTGITVVTSTEMHEAARALHGMGARHVVIKGGHLNDDPVDIWFDGHTITTLPAQRIHTRHTHGTGCTFSAAIAAMLARQAPVPEAIATAKAYITGAILHAQGIGQGNGPLNHFWHAPSLAFSEGYPSTHNHTEKGS